MAEDQRRIGDLSSAASGNSGQTTRELENGEQAALLAAIVNASFDAIISKTPDGIVTSWNEAATNLFGYRSEEMIGRSIRRIIPPDRPDEEDRILARIRVGERIEQFETVRLRKDGGAIEVSVTISPVRDEEGKIIGASKFARDITRRKRKERCVARESAEVLRLALDASRQGVWKLEAGSEVRDWDARCRELFGIGDDVPVTHDVWASAILPEDRVETEAAMARALDPADPVDEYAREYRIVRPDGKVLRLSSTGRAVFEADPAAPSGRRPLFVTGTLRDVTEERLAFEASIEQAKRDHYFTMLEKRLHDAATARDAVTACCEELGRELDATFTGVAELEPDGEHAAVESAWRGNGAPLPIARYRLAETGALRSAAILAGNIVALEDVERDLRTSNDAEAQAFYSTLGVRSSLDVPLARGGEVRAILFVAFAAPHHWTDVEIALARETLNRASQAVERARIEQELRVTAKRLELVLKTSPIVVFNQGRDLRYTWIYNTAFGFKDSDVIGKRDIDLFERAEDATALEALKREVIRTGSGRREEVVVYIAGADRRYDLSVEPLRDANGIITGVTCAATDITELKRAEAALRASEERFRGIYEHAGTGIALMDMNGRFQSCNPAYAAMLGYSEAELRERDFASLMHPEDHDAALVEIRRLIAQEIPSFEIVNRYVDKGGKAIWVHKHVSLIRDDGGRPTGIVALLTDMTERKRHEERIRLLVSEVNHRSKNMLAVVQAVARQTIAANHEDFLTRFGERVRALATAQDLLVKYEWRGVDVGELVRSQLSHFIDLIGERITLAGPALFITASASQTIGMALHELATNAGKYGALSDTGGRVDVEWRIGRADPGEETFTIEWRESGGPQVTMPDRRGFGTTVVGTLAEISLGAEVALTYASTGLCWRLVCPAEEVTDPGRATKTAN